MRTSTDDTNAGSLWERFHDELHAFLRARVPSDEVAGDLLQSAFLRAHQSLKAGEVPENPRAWLYRIVRNLITDAHRHGRAQRTLAGKIARDPEGETRSGAEEQDAFAVVARALPMFIDELEPKYRDALRMTELEGLTQNEAAQRVGISLSGMKSRVQRGRKLVFESLQRCCEFELDARRHIVSCTSHSHREDCC